MSLVVLILTGVSVAAQAGSAQGASSSSSEQVVFSKTGAFDPSLGPYGFWIWCEASSANPYVGNCSGSVYFYAFGTPKHVVDGSVTEIADGQYQIHVLSSKDNGASVDCTLTNAPPPMSGPHNSITVQCTAPTTGTGTATGSVVNVTGPSS